MSDDIRRKKKKAGRKKEPRPAESVVRKECDVKQEENTNPEPSPEPASGQEKQSLLSKTLFFSAILGETLISPIALSFQQYFIRPPPKKRTRVLTTSDSEYVRTRVRFFGGGLPNQLE